MTAFDFIGGAVCHRIAERSLFIDGKQSPVCARCGGIYMSVVVGYILLVLTNRIKGNKPPTIPQIFFTAFLPLPLMADGCLSYLGLWRTNNLLRALTGALCGSVIPIIIALVFNFDDGKTNDKPIIDGLWQELSFVGVCVAASIAVYCGFGTYNVVSAAICLGILLVYAGIFAVLIRSFAPKTPTKKVLGAALFIGALALIAAAYGFSYLKALIVVQEVV